jgi:hypothetical protein
MGILRIFERQGDGGCLKPAEGLEAGGAALCRLTGSQPRRQTVLFDVQGRSDLQGGIPFGGAPCRGELRGQRSTYSRRYLLYQAHGRR